MCVQTGAITVFGASRVSTALPRSSSATVYPTVDTAIFPTKHNVSLCLRLC